MAKTKKFNQNFISRMLLDSIKSKEFHSEQVKFYEVRIKIYSELLNKKLDSDPDKNSFKNVFERGFK
jgi:hypothetical protein